MKFEIRYGLSGGFGGCEMQDWEEIEADDLDEANKIAYEEACEVYESYVGTNGIRDIDDIMEEDGEDIEEAEMTYSEEMESWIDYEARVKE